MTASPPDTGGHRSWWVRPIIVLPAVSALVILLAIFVPTPLGPRGGDQRLSTLSTEPMGGRILFDLAERLGWRTERRLHASQTAAPGTIQAVLSPVIELRRAETHGLLEHVRAGGGALVVIGPTMGAFMDSLHLGFGGAGTAVPVEPHRPTCSARGADDTSLWFGGPPQMRNLRWLAPAPAGVVTLMQAHEAQFGQRKDSLGASVVAFPYGKGRMVVAADPDVFRNDAVRDCSSGFDVVAVRALEYLRDGGSEPRIHLSFDEYHQAHGAHPGTIRAAMDYLGGSPSGRLLLQLTIAGVILLIASAPRIVPPPDRRRLERRSPLEQVDALARAYERVNATRTAAQRLVRGLRRRTERGGRIASRDRSVLADEEWLARISTADPTLGDDIARVRTALTDRLTPKEFAALGPALHRIESTLTRH